MRSKISRNCPFKADDACYGCSNLQQKREVVRSHSEDEEMESQEEEEESFGKSPPQKKKFAYVKLPDFPLSVPSVPHI